ncbi:oxysterol-binding protein-related protein 2A isoform X2 [Diospyros lotus]|uniref:oxysterol-binding protein-related protein 2A isoform X2 n=1 Tax=Diospyros lotus TaxID=55363 RepID=UPI002254F318|nr:oxysterol-binding protein-related protein 2A isoform X2 [Diospyros lotus]
MNVILLLKVCVCAVCVWCVCGCRNLGWRFDRFNCCLDVRMRVKEMHPLCCISLESPGMGDRSPEVAVSRSGSIVQAALGSGGSEGNAWRPAGSEDSFAGVLFKWTNYGKGWRSRWFLLRNGVLSYSKIVMPDTLAILPSGDDVRLIGDASSGRLSRLDSSGGRRKNHRTVGIVHLKVSSFRESKSDERRFYIFTATKTLHLRTSSKSDRVAWIEALVSSRSLFALRRVNSLSFVPNDISLPTERIKKRLLEEGISEVLVKDCEQIILSEFSEVQKQFKVLCEERSNLLDTVRQLEAANIEAEGSGIHDSEYQLTRHEISSVERGKYSECSTTESSDDIEKQEFEEVSDAEEAPYFDTEEYFSEPNLCCESANEVVDCISKRMGPEKRITDKTLSAKEETGTCTYLQIERRKKLPDPVEKEKGVSLWSMIKDNVGKDLTRICLPVYFNEPISSLQKCFEDLEYSDLLDRAYEHGKAGNSLLRVLNVAAFAISGYASSEGRHCKPFNPLLGETYEADYPEKGIRFFSEKVSHHPTLIACHCEGKGWKFWGDSNLRTKFWGTSIQLDPVGTITLKFDDGEIFQWSKVTTSICNLILGKVYLDHHGLMHIRGNHQYSCKLKFKEQSILDRNPHQVHGFVEDVTGKKVATLFGKWDDGMYYVNGDGAGKPKEISNASLLWKRCKPPPNVTRYNMTPFAITLNELTPGLQEKLPPTDSRLRPDQRHLENGEYEKANAEKLRLERRQRMSRKLQESGWKPRWFQREGEDGPFRYGGGYWEAREWGKWDRCPDIFGEFNEELVNSFEESLIQ